MRQPFVGLVLAAIIGTVVADYFPTLTAPILLIAITGALAGWRWGFAPPGFCGGRRDIFRTSQRAN